MNNSADIVTTMPRRFIRPTEQHDLKEITTHIRTVLEEWVSKFSPNFALLSNKKLRTAENIFMIIGLILIELSQIDEGLLNISSIPKKSPKRKSPKKNSNELLTLLIWDNQEKYINNTDLLLKDLEIYEAYYGKSEIDKSRAQLSTLVTTAKYSQRFRDAFAVAQNYWKIIRDGRYSYMHLSEFEIDSRWLIRFNETTSDATKNIEWIRDRIQTAYEDIMTLDL